MRRKWITIVGLCLVVLPVMVFAEESKTANFSGTVVGTDGVAIEGVSLELYLLTIDQSSYSYSARSVGQTTSDSEGKFVFSVSLGNLKGYAVYCCLAQKEGLSCGWASVMASNEATWTITLGEPQKIIGFVQNPDGTGVAEAEVRLVMLGFAGRNEDGFMLGIEPVDAFVTKTCSDGRFEFDNLPDGASAEFLVKKPGKGTLVTFTAGSDPSSGLTYKAGQTDIILTMEDGCKVTGIVMTQDSQEPVEGIAVLAREAGIPINLASQPVLSAADGVFEITDLTPGEYTLMIQSDDWIAKPVQLDVQSDMGTKIELTKGGTLEVKVIDSETKEPVAGVNIYARDEQTQQHQGFNTDENGLGRKQVLPGTYKIGAHKQGYRSSNEAVSAVVEDSKTKTVTIELGGQPKIMGLVMDLDNKPVEGAEVRLFPNHGPNRDGIKSDEKGQFTLSWDPGQMGWTEGEFYLLATHSDKKLAGVTQIAEDDKEATIKLEKGITAKGRVINSDGELIVGARVSLQFHGSRFSSSCGMDTNTGPSGEYEFSPLAVEQRYSVHVSNAKGYGNGRKEISPDSDTKEVSVDDIILQVADQKVTGQVVDIDGKGLADVQLHCYGESQPNISAKTDKDGQFTLDPVCEGEINISANYRNGQEWQHGNVRTEGGAEDVKVIVSSQGGGRQFIPKKPVSLVGKDLPDVSVYGVEIPQDANSILIFAWDMNQRPSRHFIKELGAKADLLEEKGVTVLLVNAAPVEKEKLDAWLQKNAVTWPCGVITKNAEDVKFKMGIQGLPWLILTDADRKVIAEGFKVEEIEAKLNDIQQ